MMLGGEKDEEWEPRSGRGRRRMAVLQEGEEGKDEKRVQGGDNLTKLNTFTSDGKTGNYMERQFVSTGAHDSNINVGGIR